jgi:membrane dipeptidase
MTASSAASDLHAKSIIIDGLMISKWSRDVFEHMHRGGLTAINCTCCVWDGFHSTMENIAQWKKWFEEYSDILLQVHTAADIRRAKQENKVGIILGWQNTSGIEDRLEFLPVFRDLGVRVMQLTYNTQNWVGTGCWESRDGGLSDFGRAVVHRMNDLGILVDLSHVGAKTSEDAIRHSKKPVAVTHGCPAALKPHARNKTDAQLKLLADHGGFAGFATYTPFMPNGPDTTLDDCVDGIEHFISILGEDHVGIGTDFTQDQDLAFFTYLGSDKGDGRRVTAGYAAVPPQPKGLEKIEKFPNLTAAMLNRGWPEAKVKKVMGENWLRFLGEVWGA